MIRVWKLGDHKEGFLPGEDAVNKLCDILAEHQKSGKGDIDVVWDSMITVTVIADDGTVTSDDIVNLKTKLNEVLK
jgi:hypothetical protein